MDKVQNGKFPGDVEADRQLTSGITNSMNMLSVMKRQRVIDYITEGSS